MHCYFCRSFEVDDHKEPCEMCKFWMRDHVILIAIDAQVTNIDGTPKRVGYYTVVSESWVRQNIFSAQTQIDLFHNRVGYLDSISWERFELPRRYEKG